MQRVLSFQMTRGTGESSEYVTKRLCFSFLFSVGFLCLLCGFMLGRFATERSIETQAQKKRAELAGNSLQQTEYFQQLALKELERASFNHNHTYVICFLPHLWNMIPKSDWRIAKKFPNIQLKNSTSNLMFLIIIELFVTRNWQMSDSLKSNMQRINELFSNLSLVHEVTNHTSCIRATVRGLQEPGESLSELTFISMRFKHFFFILTPSKLIFSLFTI